MGERRGDLDGDVDRDRREALRAMGVPEDLPVGVAGLLARGHVLDAVELRAFVGEQHRERARVPREIVDEEGRCLRRSSRAHVRPKRGAIGVGERAAKPDAEWAGTGGPPIGSKLKVERVGLGLGAIPQVDPLEVMLGEHRAATARALLAVIVRDGVYDKACALDLADVAAVGIDEAEDVVEDGHETIIG